MSVPDDMPKGYWEEVRQLNEDAVPSVMLGFIMDIQPVRMEIINCRTEDRGGGRGCSASFAV